MRYFHDPKEPVNPRTGIVPTAPDTVQARVLAAGVAESITVPDGAKYVELNANATPYYVRFGAIAAVPAADVTDGTAPEVNIRHRRIPDGVTTISVVAPAATIVTASFWS